jgi:predicted membrane-bound mannosyltransferase
MALISTDSNSNKLSQRDLLIIAGAVILITAIYLLTSQFTYGIGFPLDDSWIHQTYARNLALRGEWAFRPGIPSAGSTSPLWSTLLALGFLLRLSPYIWTYLLGAATLFALAVISEWAVRKLIDSYRPHFPWV